MITSKTVSLNESPVAFAFAMLHRLPVNECLFVEALQAGKGSLNAAWDYVHNEQNKDLKSESFAGFWGDVTEQDVMDHQAKCYAIKSYLEDLSIAINGDIEIER